MKLHNVFLSGIGFSLAIVGACFWLFAWQAAGRKKFWLAGLDQDVYFAVTRNAVTLAGALVVGVTLFFSYRKQQTAEKAQELAVASQATATEAQELATRTLKLSLDKHDLDQVTELRNRYSRSAEQLASQKLAVQMAGMHSLGALADDWAERDFKDEQQVCISLLCSYVNNLGKATPEGWYQQNSTAVEVMDPRMRFDAAAPRRSWADRRITLDSVAFLGHLSNMRIDGGKWSFTDCYWPPLRYWVNFRIEDDSTLLFHQGNDRNDKRKQMAGFKRSEFRGGLVDLKQGGDLISETVSFEECTFSGAAVAIYTGSRGSLSVDFTDCVFSSGAATLMALAGKNTVRFIRCRFESPEVVRLTAMRKHSVDVLFHGCTFSGDAAVMQLSPKEAVLTVIEDDFDDLSDLEDKEDA